MLSLLATFDKHYTPKSEMPYNFKIKNNEKKIKKKKLKKIGHEKNVEV